MTRLCVVVEGQTEAAFVEYVLRPHLAAIGMQVWAELLRGGQGGGRKVYDAAKRDLGRLMRQHNRPDAWFTTMLDLYALKGELPNREQADRASDPYERVRILEEGMSAEMSHRRFVPYLQLHEFEALLFVDPAQFTRALPVDDGAMALLRAVTDAYGSPELIDEGDTTHPSKRIENALPRYRKRAHGSQIAAAIGLPAMRDKCPHFDEWVTKLEQLPSL